MTRKNRNRALRNTAIALAVLFVVWLVLGAPLPTAQLRLRRAERQCLRDYSQVVWRYDSRNYLGQDVNLRGLDTLVGLTPTEVHVYARELNVCPRDPNRPTLMVLPAELPYDTGDGQEQAPAFLAVDPPAGTASARLTVYLEMKYVGGSFEDGEPIIRKYKSEKYVMDGERNGETFLFRLTRHQAYFGGAWEDGESMYRYVAEDDAFYSLRRLPNGEVPIGYFSVASQMEFFDRDGTLITGISLGVKSGTLFL